MEQVILYGSRVKGNYRSGSLIAPALRGGNGLTERVLYSILNELDDLPLPYGFVNAKLTTRAWGPLRIGQSM